MTDRQAPKVPPAPSGGVAAAPLKCGIVMPISQSDGCPEAHWTEVRAILSSAIEDAGFAPLLVSDADDVGIIQKNIIQNIYDNPVIVCDVSSKNPNVMFELGVRLAFDKPAIIVKDDQTSYSFDTSPIEHLGYPRDLRFSKIVEFKKILAEKIVATHRRATEDPGYSPFLKNFGDFTVAKIDEKELPIQDFIIENLKQIQRSVRRLESQNRNPTKREIFTPSFKSKSRKVTVVIESPTEKIINNVDDILEMAGLTSWSSKEGEGGRREVMFMSPAEDILDRIVKEVSANVPDSYILVSGYPD